MRYRFPWLYGLVVAMVGSLIGTANVASAEPGGSSSNYTSNKILVKLNPAVDVRAFAASAGLDADPDSIEQLGKRPIYRLEIVDGLPVPRKANQLERDARVQYAEPDYEGQLPEARLRSTWVVGGDTFEYVAQWAPAKMRLPEAHAVNSGAGETVAILDTGADLEHPALAGRLVPGYDFVDGDADPSEVSPAYADASEFDTASVQSAYGHGTHVAGLIALAAPEASIMPLRTLGSDGIGTIWMQVRALRYAVANGADVINLSFGFSEQSKLLNDVLAEITCSRASLNCQSVDRPGVVVVAAAGNSGLSNREYPAAEPLPGVVAVAASTSDDTIASFSTYGSWVKVAAPGDRIISSIPGGGFATWSGTSMAAPLTAGTVALVRATYPALRPAETVARITNTGVALHGQVRRRIDAAAALGLSRLSQIEE